MFAGATIAALVAFSAGPAIAALVANNLRFDLVLDFVLEFYDVLCELLVNDAFSLP